MSNQSQQHGRHGRPNHQGPRLAPIPAAATAFQGSAAGEAQLLAGNLKDVLGYKFGSFGHVAIATGNPYGPEGLAIYRLNAIGRPLHMLAVKQAASAGAAPRSALDIESGKRQLLDPDQLIPLIGRSGLPRVIGTHAGPELVDIYFNLIGAVAVDSNPASAAAVTRRLFRLPRADSRESECIIRPENDLKPEVKLAFEGVLSHHFRVTDYLASAVHPKLMNGAPPAEDARLAQVGEEAFKVCVALGLRSNPTLQGAKDIRQILAAAYGMGGVAVSPSRDSISTILDRARGEGYHDYGDFVRRLLGAVYLDGGYDAAIKVTRHLFPQVYGEEESAKAAPRVPPPPRAAEPRQEKRAQAPAKGGKHKKQREREPAAAPQPDHDFYAEVKGLFSGANLHFVEPRVEECVRAGNKPGWHAIWNIKGLPNVYREGDTRDQALQLASQAVLELMRHPDTHIVGGGKKHKATIVHNPGGKQKKY